MRVLVAGFQHETNTFSHTPAGFDNFVNGEGFPALRRGEGVFELEAVNIPMGGFLAAMREHEYSTVPVIWAAASPSGPVTRDAYERITGEILDAARETLPDAVYLDLHGAMVAEHYDDGEGELLARLRAIVGPVPIVVSLDLHANVTDQMMATADAMVAFRTYPHVDMADTGKRAAQLLVRLINGETLHRSSRKIPFLIPTNAQCTDVEPARTVYERLDTSVGNGTCLSFAAGFPATDFPECGPTIWGHGGDRTTVAEAVDQLYDEIVSQEAQWQVTLLDPAEAVAEACRLAKTATGPVLIADAQDNPGAGGDATTTGMLSALVDAGVDDAVLASICDPSAALAAHDAGVGATVTLSLGGNADIPGTGPFEGTFVVESLSDGRCRFEGSMMHNNEVDSGPSGCLRIGGVRVGVTSRKAQIMDRAQLRMLGITPEDHEIVVVKSSVHFRADFEPIAAAVLVAKAPGPMAAEPADLPWRRLREGLRVSPLGPPFELPGSAD